ncbi:TPA: hypothetical protein ACTZGD_002109 [Raoultella planticola]
MTIEIKENYTTAVISTAHIAKEDTELLTDASYNPRTDTCQHNSQKKLLSFLPSSDNPRHYRVFLDILHVYFFMLRGEYFNSSLIISQCL